MIPWNKTHLRERPEVLPSPLWTQQAGYCSCWQKQSIKQRVGNIAEMTRRSSWVHWICKWRMQWSENSKIQRKPWNMGEVVMFLCVCSVVSDSLRPHGLQPTRLLCPWDSVGFSRQEYWSGLPFPSPGDLPNPGIKPRSPALQTDALPSEPPGKPWAWVVNSNSFPAFPGLTDYTY